MAEAVSDAWLSIIGIGEDGMAGLCEASRAALAGAEVVFGGPRHLALAGIANGRAWPVPFDIAPVLAERGRRVAVLVSGDPFWFGAGSALAAHVAPGDYRVWPAPSTFSRAAALLGWRLETTGCFGLHAAPFATLLPGLHDGGRAICLLRDGAAAGDLAAWLTEQGFGASRLHVLEALGGARARARATTAAGYDLADVAAPVAVAIEMAGGMAGQGLPATVLPDEAFAHDGQITRQPVRALTLAALAPRPGERLWDIGAGSGSIAIEWCRAGGSALAIEPRIDRAGNIRANAARFGVAARLDVIDGAAPAVLAGLPVPAAVFVGGGANEAVLTALWALLPAAARVVVNAVTLETEALLARWQVAVGGTLLRIDLAHAAPLGTMRGWQAARPIVQWSVTR